jgi:hypothetical protein
MSSQPKKGEKKPETPTLTKKGSMLKNNDMNAPKNKGLLSKFSFRPFWMKKNQSDPSLEFNINSEISSPFDFQHKGHVDYDDETGITGMKELLDSETEEMPLVETVYQKSDEPEIQYDENIDTTTYTDANAEQPLYLGLFLFFFKLFSS